jgi:hypothetical protein
VPGASPFERAQKGVLHEASADQCRGGAWWRPTAVSQDTLPDGTITSPWASMSIPAAEMDGGARKRHAGEIGRAPAPAFGSLAWRGRWRVSDRGRRAPSTAASSSARRDRLELDGVAGTDNDQAPFAAIAVRSKNRCSGSVRVQPGSMLVLWEAQFGDFANEAQLVTDQFWPARRQVATERRGIALPHGYGGGGSFGAASNDSCNSRRRTTCELLTYDPAQYSISCGRCEGCAP